MESSQGSRTEQDMEVELRARVDSYNMGIFKRIEQETNKRWTFEAEIKRPYFHVTELDEPQLANWRKYLDFEESEGDYSRTTFLYERCLVAAAYYDEFWLRYARWMLGQMNKTEEVRNIYQRASCIYAPIARPAVRLQWALFEEMNKRVNVAQSIYEAMLITMPGHVETIIAWANSARRQDGVDAAISVYKSHLESADCDMTTKSALIAEWARLLWKGKGSAHEARDLFRQSQHAYLDSRSFWKNYLLFAVEQPASGENDNAQTDYIRAVFEDIRRKSQLPIDAVKDLARDYMAFLLERGGTEAAKEYMTLDREINS